MQDEHVNDGANTFIVDDDEVFYRSEFMKKSGGHRFAAIPRLSRFATYLSELAFSNSDNPALFNVDFTDRVVMGV